MHLRGVMDGNQGNTKKRRQIERNCKVLLLQTAPKLSVKRAEELWQELQGTQEDHGFRQPKTGLR